MKTLLVATLVGLLCFSIGKASVDPIILQCQSTDMTLIASYIRKDGVTCVYMEPWKIKGKLKRIENVIQKKTT